MGLCKCPKKKVTNLFCFEHRVTVCEFCIIESHQKCIVQSYLQWLNDSDYSPVCQLCKKDLEDSDCVRLVCLDLFHKECFDNWGKTFPPNTAPAGYRCPICSSSVFPAPNLVSPIAEALRETLGSFSWTRNGLGMPLVTMQDSKVEDIHNTNLSAMSNGHTNLGDEQEALLHRFDSSSNRKEHSVYVNHLDSQARFNVKRDDEDLKYHRRSTVDSLKQWMRSLQKPSSRNYHRCFKGPTGFILLVLIILAAMMILMFFLRHLTKIPDDPMFDPLNNPNIKIVD